ncbi:MAG: SLC13 family permease [Fusobacterium gastrosuis]|uniref:SLC13 family permease n=1 Tax=Fusobacterium gastrosuis TaxID=1755100 RepID=UPI002A977290|nr:SLC13 family permease [Fusobacterium gastrosuis]
MGLDIISVVALIYCIVIGFKKKINVGLICIVGALIFGRLSGFTDKEIISGFNSNLFITLMGVTFLFAILNINGTIELLAKRIVSFSGNKNWIIPIIVFLVGYILTAIGPGAIPMLAIIPAFAIPISIARGYHPIMLALIGEFGVFAGRMSPITPEGILVRDLLSKTEITENISYITKILVFNQTITGIVCAVFTFIFYKGYKVNIEKNHEKEKILFNKKQKISLLGSMIVVILVIFFKYNVGLISFAMGAILLCLGVAEEKKAISSIPWGVLIMISGVGTLMKLVITVGGIELVSVILSKFMNSYTVSSVMGTTAGIMSWFSSGLGVVFPTLIPTVSSIAKLVGNESLALEIASLIIIGGTFAGLSPFSTAGGLIVATAMAESKEKNIENQEEKLFKELILWSVIPIVIFVTMSLIGFYSII